MTLEPSWLCTIQTFLLVGVGLVVTHGCHPEQQCNGSVTLCARTLDQVVFAGTHNAMSNEDEGWLAPNQHHSIERQLADGIRALMLDTHDDDGTVALCHGYCSLGSRSFLEALDAVNQYLDEDSGAVVLLLIEDAVGVSETEAVFEQSSLIERLFVMPQDGSWPTLGEMVMEDQRVVVFAENQGPPPSWYHHMWNWVYDTPYSFSDASEFSCDLNRGQADNALYLINHWIGNPLPDAQQAATVNTAEVLGARVALCAQQWGRLSNIVAVDFYDLGDLFEVVATQNGL